MVAAALLFVVFRPVFRKPYFGRKVNKQFIQKPAKALIQKRNSSSSEQIYGIKMT